MQRKLVLWLLNRVWYWDHDAMIGALKHSFLGFGGNQVVLGQRDGCNPGVLMHEGEDADEYFIPIPVKCLGDTANINVPGNAQGTLATLKAAYPQYFGAPGPLSWGTYWDGKPKAVFNNLKMVSARGEGYYRALQQFNERYGSDYRHVLVGYSQGGLVARYLAYLDEQLFGNALIDGVVTVDSPNFGSPVGRPANADNVMETLALVVAGFGQLDEGSFPNVATQLKQLVTGNKVDLPWLLKLLDSALITLRANPALLKQKDGVFLYLETARKWLSGLSPNGQDPVFARAESAFFDLDIGMVATPGTVLNCVNKSPLQKIKHAAVVGTDNQLDAFVDAGIQTFAGTQGWFTKQVINLIQGRLEATLRAVLAIAGTAYCGVMDEQQVPVPTDPDMAARIADFQSGVPATDARYMFQNGIGFRSRAHDFAIPSAYQLIEKAGPAFLGTWVNPDASHLSGADINQSGKRSQDFVVEILERM